MKKINSFEELLSPQDIPKEIRHFASACGLSLEKNRNKTAINALKPEPFFQNFFVGRSRLRCMNGRAWVYFCAIRGKATLIIHLCSLLFYFNCKPTLRKFFFLTRIPEPSGNELYSHCQPHTSLPVFELTLLAVWIPSFLLL